MAQINVFKDSGISSSLFTEGLSSQVPTAGVTQIEYGPHGEVTRIVGNQTNLSYGGRFGGGGSERLPQNQLENNRIKAERQSAIDRSKQILEATKTRLLTTSEIAELQKLQAEALSPQKTQLLRPGGFQASEIFSSQLTDRQERQMRQEQANLQSQQEELEIKRQTLEATQDKLHRLAIEATTETGDLPSLTGEIARFEKQIADFEKQRNQYNASVQNFNAEASQTVPQEKLFSEEPVVPKTAQQFAKSGIPEEIQARTRLLVFSDGTTIRTNQTGFITAGDFGSVQGEQVRQVFEVGQELIGTVGESLGLATGKAGVFVGTQLRGAREAVGIPAFDLIALPPLEQGIESVGRAGKGIAQVGSLFLPGGIGIASTVIQAGASSDLGDLAVGGAAFVGALAGGQKVLAITEGIKGLGKVSQAGQIVLSKGLPVILGASIALQAPEAFKSNEGINRFSSELAGFTLGAKAGEAAVKGLGGLLTKVSPLKSTTVVEAFQVKGQAFAETFSVQTTSVKKFLEPEQIFTTKTQTIIGTAAEPQPLKGFTGRGIKSRKLLEEINPQTPSLAPEQIGFQPALIPERTGKGQEIMPSESKVRFEKGEAGFGEVPQTQRVTRQTLSGFIGASLVEAGKASKGRAIELSDGKFEAVKKTVLEAKKENFFLGQSFLQEFGLMAGRLVPTEGKAKPFQEKDLAPLFREKLAGQKQIEFKETETFFLESPEAKEFRNFLEITGQSGFVKAEQKPKPETEPAPINFGKAKFREPKPKPMETIPILFEKASIESLTMFGAKEPAAVSQTGQVTRLFFPTQKVGLQAFEGKTGGFVEVLTGKGKAFKDIALLKERAPRTETSPEFAGNFGFDGARSKSSRPLLEGQKQIESGFEERLLLEDATGNELKSFFEQTKQLLSKAEKPSQQTFEAISKGLGGFQEQQAKQGQKTVMKFSSAIKEGASMVGTSSGTILQQLTKSKPKVETKTEGKKKQKTFSKSEVEQFLSSGSRQDRIKEESRLDFNSFVGLREMFRAKNAGKSRDRNLFGSSSNERVGVATREGIKSATGLREATGLAFGLGSMTGLKFGTPEPTLEITTTITGIPNIPPFIPQRTPPPTKRGGETSMFSLDFLDSKPKPSQTYDTYVKERGKFKKVNDQAEPLNRATNIGVDFTDNTPTKTFQLIGTGKNTKEPDDLFSNLFKYRPQKTKGDKLRFVEKNEYGIDTQGEFQKITVEGWKAIRNKRDKVFSGVGSFLGKRKKEKFNIYSDFD